MEYIYALIEYGSYDEYNFYFVKIKRGDKEKFIQFIEDIEKVYHDSYNILAFFEPENIEIYDDEFSEWHIKTIEYLYNDLVIERLEFIERMKDRHYLYKRQNEVKKLLKYDFS